ALVALYVGAELTLPGAHPRLNRLLPKIARRHRARREDQREQQSGAGPRDRQRERGAELPLPVPGVELRLLRGHHLADIGAHALHELATAVVLDHCQRDGVLPTRLELESLFDLGELVVSQALDGTQPSQLVGAAAEWGPQLLDLPRNGAFGGTVRLEVRRSS